RSPRMEAELPAAPVHDLELLVLPPAIAPLLEPRVGLGAHVLDVERLVAVNVDDLVIAAAELGDVEHLRLGAVAAPLLHHGAVGRAGSGHVEAFAADRRV